MAQVELIMPKMGESVAEATIIRWLKKEGDKVAMDEPVLEIATDKVDTEIPSAAEGVITKILFKEGDVVQVGKAIALISTDATAPVNAPETKSPVAAETVKAQPQTQKVIAETAVKSNVKIEKVSASGKFYSPLVRNIAKAEGITMEELETIPGTGLNGRVTKNDILSYLPKKGKTSTVVTETTKIQQQVSVNGTQHKPAVSVNSGDEIIEMDRMRKLISEHMVMSKHVSPHVTSFVEADVTNIVMWREKMKSVFQNRDGEKLTFTPLFIEAIVKAIKDFPMINISVDGTKIIVKKDINIGMATALPSGNLIVPVIKNSGTKNLLGIAADVNALANAARNNKLKADDTQGGTFTLTNVGTFGSLMGTPIINQPQVAILAVGAIKKRPMVMETEDGDVIAIRHMMYLSLSYDHRIIDGSLGATFLTAVANELEGFDADRDF